MDYKYARLANGTGVCLPAQEKADPDGCSLKERAPDHLAPATPPKTRRCLLVLGSLVFLGLLGYAASTCFAPRHGQWSNSMINAEAIPCGEAATPVVRLGRRQDNDTASSTRRSSTTSPSSVNFFSVPTPSSPSSPPSPTTSTTRATTLTTILTTTRVTSSVATTTPSSTPPSATGVTITNPGTSASARPSILSTETRVPNAGSSSFSSKPVEGTPRTTTEPRPPSTLNGGTLTRLTTKDSSPGSVDPQGSTRTSISNVPQSSKEVVATLTSTMSNGNVVVVTATSYVAPDPVITSSFGSTTVVAPQLHNVGSAFRRDGGLMATIVVVVAGVVLGAAMI